MRSAFAVTPSASPSTADGADEQLVRAIAHGDRDRAVGELYDRYASRLYGFGVRLLGDRGLAEEVVQETFVRAWRAAGRFDPQRGAVRSWLFTIARHVAIDLHRRRPATSLSAETDELGEDDAALESVILELTVRDALDAISSDHREVLEIAYVDGLSQAETALRLGLPLGTVKSRTFHALREMRVALTQRGIDV